jgi:hypothetical protein
MSLYMSLSSLSFYDEHTHKFISLLFFAAPFILGKIFDSINTH